MNRPLHTWIAFTACLVVVLVAMGWISSAVLRLERTEIQSRRQAEQEENVRLALWRLDSALSPVLAEESLQPWYVYQPYYLHGRTPAQAKKGDAPIFTTVPSPLLKQRSPHTLLHFQIDSKGEMTSPQVIPASKSQAVQPELQSAAERIAFAEKLTQLHTMVTRQALAEKLPAPPAEPQYAANPGNIDETNSSAPNSAGNDLAKNNLNVQKMVGEPQAELAKQQARSQNEYQKRSQIFEVQQFQQSNSWSNAASANDMNPLAFNSQEGLVKQGIMTPLWLGSALVLARRVQPGREEYLQGCWLDWTELQGWLRSQVSDLLPNVSFEAASAGPGERQTNLLAALPVRVVAGPLPFSDDGLALFSPLRISLLVAWLCVLLAAGAVGALLMGAMSLSERRGAFVSAVTHELRTPLTTFRLYTEMLSEQMVPDEVSRLKYVNTLRIEADRLSHLVENVLAYAQLERGRVGGRLENTTWQDLLAKFTTRLSERAAQAGMVVVLDAGATPVAIRTDPSAVEQILFNLVDNACKYAKAADEKTIHLEVVSANGGGQLRVRDHGPGFSDTERRTLFQPFSKSARQAAHSAPGVGLGLALSRRLARQMGGDLTLETGSPGGACFVLTLPRPE